MISRALQKKDTPSLPTIEISCFKYNHLSLMLDSAFQRCGMKSSFTNLTYGEVNKNTIYVILDSGDDPILSDPSSKDFEKITQLLTLGKRILWITTPQSNLEFSNERGLITGLARVARAENDELQLVTLSLQSETSQSDSDILNVILDVLHKSFGGVDFPPELEYKYRNNRLEILRLLPSTEVDNFMAEDTDQSRSEIQKFHSDVPLSFLSQNQAC